MCVQVCAKVGVNKANFTHEKHVSKREKDSRDYGNWVEHTQGTWGHWSMSTYTDDRMKFFTNPHGMGMVVIQGVLFRGYYPLPHCEKILKV